MDTVFTLWSHAFFKGTTLPCQAGWRGVSPLFMLIVGNIQYRMCQSMFKSILIKQSSTHQPCKAFVSVSKAEPGTNFLKRFD